VTPAVGPKTTAPGAVTPQTAPTPTGSPAAAPPLYLRVNEANAAVGRSDFSTALRLYRQAAADDSQIEARPPRQVAPGPELRAFARFRIVVVDAQVGQEDDARATLDQMRRLDAGTPFLRLALAFWDRYGMTADVKAACGHVASLVKTDPEPVLRSLNNWGPQGRDLAAEDVCPVKN
jgi:hypothetical protein